MVCTDLPALQVLQLPHKISHSLQLATDTELAHHCIQYQFFPFGFLQSTTCTLPHRSTTRPHERAASHIKVTRPPCLFRLLPWENVNRSTTLIYPMWMMSSH